MGLSRGVQIRKAALILPGSLRLGNLELRPRWVESWRLIKDQELGGDSSLPPTASRGLPSTASFRSTLHELNDSVKDFRESREGPKGWVSRRSQTVPVKETAMKKRL